MTEEYNLESLKEDYKKIQEKFELPEFNELNDDFNIEKLSEVETESLIREIRRMIADRFYNYLRFVESILNPVNSSMFIYSIIKSFEIKEKDKLTEIYKKLAQREVELIELDIKFDEEKEVTFIKESYKIWQDIKEDMLGVIKVIKKNWDNKLSKDKKDYFG
jgi:hypothetical protein